MNYIGVDPGMTGAIAIISGDFIEVGDFGNMDGLRLLTGAVMGTKGCYALVEKVHSMPKQGVSTTFKFGKATGRAIGWLEALGIPYEEITPTKWRKRVFDSGIKTGDNKADSLTMARKLFPSILGRLKRKKDHNRAEALLIAEACRRGNHVCNNRKS